MGRHLVLSMAEELNAKGTRDQARGNALKHSIEHVYGEDKEAANTALQLIDSLVDRDKQATHVQLSKQLNNLNSDPVTDAQINNRWFQPVNRNPNGQGRPGRPRSRSRGRRPNTPTSRGSNRSQSPRQIPAQNQPNPGQRGGYRGRGYRGTTKGAPRGRGRQIDTVVQMSLTPRERALIGAFRM